MVHLLFGPEVRLMLQEHDSKGIKAFLESLHPATVAETLNDEFQVEEVWQLLNHTSIRHQAAIFEYFPIEWQVKLTEGTGRQHMAKLIEQMSADDRADLLRRLLPRARESLLRLVDEADRKDIATLVEHEENTAGALMTTDYAWLPENITVTEALDRLRLQAPNSETIYYIYVLNSDRKLLGVLSLRDLILTGRQTLVRDLMDKDPVAVKVKDDREHVAKELARFDLIAIPVLDDQQRLVGIVTHDDVIDVVVQEATEDVYRMGAVGPMEENYLEANFFLIWRSRAFWLACLFIAGMFTVMAMAEFQNTLSRILVLTLFVPLCISTGGNSGSQAATLITRALALGQVTSRDWWRVLRHELLMGLVLGFTLGLLGFCLAFLIPESLRTYADEGETIIVLESWRLAMVIAQAVIGICLWGTLVGSMLPLFLRRIGVDPGIASNPFVATLVDVTGIIIYFNIASFYLL
jgi:magnesium transporter